MPGLSGLFDRKESGITATPANLDAMLQAQMHQPWLQVQRHHQEPFAAGRVHLGIHRTGPQPVCDSDRRYVLWFDGELHNHAELMALYGLDRELWEGKGDAQFVLDLYLECRGWDFLVHLDGIFAIALFDTRDDTREKAVSIVSDRLGLRPLYYWLSPNLFAFSAEVKSFLALPGFPRELNRLALEEFLAYGYMLDDRTWFENVRVLEPASILRVAQSKRSQTPYWSWNDIKPLPSTVSVEEAAEEMGRLWQKSVNSRVASDHTYCLTLSGGLDSRAILAAMPENKVPIPCVTIGLAGCDDIRFAAQAAEVRHCPHYVIHLGGQEDWLQQREWFVWLVDGLLTVLHMQGSVMAPKCRELSTIMLNGYIGGVVAGGSYASGADSPLAYFRRKYSDEVTPTGFNGAEHILRLWRDSGMTIEQFSIYQRARRWVLMGSVLFSTHVEQRKPFVSKDFLSFVMSMPESYRRNSTVYRRMLLSHYPALFERIPWQTTGVPISSGKVQEWFMVRKRWLQKRLYAILEARFPGSLKSTSRSTMVDYALLTRQEPSRSFISRKLLVDGRQVYEYVPRERVIEFCKAHFAGKVDAQETIARLLTMETYLQFVFEGRDPSQCAKGVAGEDGARYNPIGSLLSGM